jgi:hypothetical protein
MGAMGMMMDKDLVRRLFDYDPESGAFTHRIGGGRRKAGDLAGHIDRLGYVIIGGAKKHYLAHRLAFMWMNGRWPESQVDHIDGNRSNNAWTNLRDVSPQGNNRNKRMHRNNKSGRIGVHWDKVNNKWVAHIFVWNKHHNLGRFSEFEDACRARLHAEIRFGFHPNHGRA